MQVPEIQFELNQTGTIVNLTGIFEGIASMKIAQIKNQVLQSQQFFDELWNIYTQLRVDAIFHFGRQTSNEKVIDKELFIVITAEGGFSGDIDQKLIDYMLKSYDKDKNDIIVIGHHGAVQLAQRGIPIKKYYKLPSKDENINVGPIIAQVQKYRVTTAYYQQYVSLMVQDVKKLSLRTAVQERGEGQSERQKAKTLDTIEDQATTIISENTYIFEPSTYAVIDHIERSMLAIMTSQIILESKLAQYASRFRAMSAANDRSKETYSDLEMMFHRAKRAVADERLKEIIIGMKGAAEAS